MCHHLCDWMDCDVPLRCFTFLTYFDHTVVSFLLQFPQPFPFTLTSPPKTNRRRQLLTFITFYNHLSGLCFDAQSTLTGFSGSFCMLKGKIHHQILLHCYTMYYQPLPPLPTCNSISDFLHLIKLL